MESPKKIVLVSGPPYDPGFEAARAVDNLYYSSPRRRIECTKYFSVHSIRHNYNVYCVWDLGLNWVGNNLKGSHAIIIIQSERNEKYIPYMRDYCKFFCSRVYVVHEETNPLEILEEDCGLEECFESMNIGMSISEQMEGFTL